MSVLLAGTRRAIWVLRGVMGEHAYDDYLAHHRSTHPDDEAPPMTAREFWRDRSDTQDRNPEGRCC